ncbi:MAG TPA: DUF4037 domain-containing protein [Rectinemataceae bacterium]|nr:DUF4037 domain-containing protein [Rectinemataceae bacterium]
MRLKVERLADSLTQVISSWNSVECVALAEHSEDDTLDPYFALVLDVYHREAVPGADERHAAFSAALGGLGAFESSAAQPKDRFFFEGLPVRVEYKDAAGVDEILDRGLGFLWVLKNSGTYMFYRLESSRVLFQRSPWIDEIRAQLRLLSPEVWEGLREAFEAKMEHSLSDLGAAALLDDGFFYNVSFAGFLRYAAAVLFIKNRRFEPSHRAIGTQLMELKELPEDFEGRWETFLRSDSDMSRSQQYKLAELIAKSILALR